MPSSTVLVCVWQTEHGSALRDRERFIRKMVISESLLATHLSQI
ncbi:MAG TPA: hypothetical protein VMZ29_16155 [Candidatus Bathyarchaeia archaeon]|nr:hypothetical protein [Candidatus Bathyarchaeia archaeon]